MICSFTKSAQIKKKGRGKWKPANWLCKYCSNEQSLQTLEEPTIDLTEIDDTEGRNKNVTDKPKESYSQLSDLLNKFSLSNGTLNPDANTFKPVDTQIIATKDVPQQRMKSNPSGKH